MNSDNSNRTYSKWSQDRENRVSVNYGTNREVRYILIEVPELEEEKLFEEVMTDISSQTWWQLSIHRCKKLNGSKHREYNSVHSKKIIYHKIKKKY